MYHFWLSRLQRAQEPFLFHMPLRACYQPLFWAVFGKITYPGK